MKRRSRKVLQLLDRLGPELFVLLTRLTQRNDVAEDLMQELFIKLYKSRRLEAAENIDSYIRRAAINLALDWRRRRDSVPANTVLLPTCRGDSPLEHVSRTEQIEMVLDALGQLRESYRQVFVMRHIQQNSYSEIARQLGKNEDHVRVLCSRAVAQLRHVLAPYGIQSSGRGRCHG